MKIFKIGGTILDDESLLNEFLHIFSSIKGDKILIHGGGKIATQVSTEMKIKVKMIDGRRITDFDSLRVVVMTYAGLINKNIVAKLNAKGFLSIGLTGVDGNILQAHKRAHPTIDYGFVGDIDAVNIDLLINLIRQNYIPVIAPISHDGKGQLLNTNADTIASEIAKAFAKMNSVEIYYLFDKPGLLADINNNQSLIPFIHLTEIGELAMQNIISEGMIPKMHNAINAIQNGIKKVVFTDVSSLTMILSGLPGGTSIIP